jgi:hypothetical protein
MNRASTTDLASTPEHHRRRFVKTAIGLPWVVVANTAVELESALQFPAWVGPVTFRTGLIVLVLGAMAWWGPQSPARRAWGRRLCGLGALLAIVGANFPAFISLLKYAIQSP